MKFKEWADKGINVAIRHKYKYSPDKTLYYADISRKGMNGRMIKDEDMFDNWEEAYNDAVKKVNKL